MVVWPSGPVDCLDHQTSVVDTEMEMEIAVQDEHWATNEEGMGGWPRTGNVSLWLVVCAEMRGTRIQ